MIRPHEAGPDRGRPPAALPGAAHNGRAAVTDAPPPPAPPRGDDRRPRLGVLLVLGAVVAWSTAGLLVRLVGLDAWTILLWRGLFGALAIAAALAAVHGRDVAAAFRAMGP